MGRNGHFKNNATISFEIWGCLANTSGFEDLTRSTGPPTFTKASD